MKKNVHIKTVLLGGVLILAFFLATAGAQAETRSDKEGDSSQGAKLWAQTCSRCHNLRNPKEFRDELWVAIVTHMRVRAGLTGQETRNILAFMQQSNSMGRKSSFKKSGLTSKQEKTGRTVNSGKNKSVASVLARGKTVFEETCVACHGEDGKGTLPGVPNFTSKNGVLSQSDEVLFDHVLNGFESPSSTLAMPAKGGNEDLSNEDIKDVLEYLITTFGS